MSDRKKILICPLDWGLGHATRCIPIIKELINQGADVYIGADKRPLDLLKKEFPDLKFIAIPGMNINYPQGILMFLKLPFFIQKFISNINKEHRFLEQLIKEHKFDVVISDNRYGLWNKNVLSIFITHQIIVKVPFWLSFMNQMIYKFSKKYIDKFDMIWIPDIEGENNVSGDLSHSYLIQNKTSFIGILSRFHKSIHKPDHYKYDLLVMLSGSEPQRTQFESLIINQLIKSDLNVAIIKGTPETSLNPTTSSNNITIYPHLETDKMQEIIESSRVILSRSGYSTIMDLATIGKNAIFIPTPGQTEQEYLAKRLTNKGLIYHQKQKDFNVETALKKCENFKGLDIENNPELLIKAVKEIMDI
jgi:uncharacterized protein (TIGR00661 family)